MKKKYLIAILFCSVMIDSGLSGTKLPPVGVFDLGYTLKLDMSNPENVRRIWAETHTLATTHGIVHGVRPLLYYFFVEHDGINITRYRWNIYRQARRCLSIRG